MKAFGSFLGGLVALALLVAIGFGLYFGVAYLLNNFDAYNSLDDQTRASIIIYSVVLLLGALIIAAAIRSIGNKSDKVVQPEKVMIYARLMELWGMNSSDFLLDEVALDQLRRPMALWAGDAVLKRFMKLCYQMELKESAAVCNKTTEGLLHDMRKDMGNANSGLVYANWQKFLAIDDPQREQAVRQSVAAMHARQEQ